MKIFLLTLFALTAFGFNSILCRMALGDGKIDPAAFTAIRILSGAIALVAILRLSNKNQSRSKSGNWTSAFFLFAYAAAFSFAYLGLTTGTGALILFGFVQFTMIAIAIYGNNKLSAIEWAGMLLAVGGLVYLVFPGITSPPLVSSLLMAVAGIAWGFYTMRGKGTQDPLADTAGNFLRAVPFSLAIAAIYLSDLRVSFNGALLAIASGAIASGVGYSVWYFVLKYHTAARAAVMQLSVPVIAAIGGFVLLSEPFGLRVVVAAILILGGISLTVIRKRRPT